MAPIVDNLYFFILGVTAFFALSNRLAHWAAIPPNPEFFLLGRVPRA